MERAEPLKAAFFKTEKGNQPCRDFIISLNQEDKKEVGAKIFEVQEGFPIGLPLVRKMNSGLWEIRVDLSDGICRILFYNNEQYNDFIAWFCKKIAENTAKRT